MKKPQTDKNFPQQEISGVYQTLYKSLRPPKLKPDASLHRMKSMKPLSVTGIHKGLVKEEEFRDQQA